MGSGCESSCLTLSREWPLAGLPAATLSHSTAGMVWMPSSAAVGPPILMGSGEHLSPCPYLGVEEGTAEKQDSVGGKRWPCRRGRSLCVWPPDPLPSRSPGHWHRLSECPAAPGGRELHPQPCPPSADGTRSSGSQCPASHLSGRPAQVRARLHRPWLVLLPGTEKASAALSPQLGWPLVPFFVGSLLKRLPWPRAPLGSLCVRLSCAG